MVDETQTTQPDPGEADNAVAGDKAAEVDAENAGESVMDSGESATTSEETGAANDSEVAEGSTEETNTESTGESQVNAEVPVDSNVPANTTLDYGQHMEVNVNGKQYSGDPLVVPTDLVETVKKNLFDAHGVTPNN